MTGAPRKCCSPTYPNHFVLIHGDQSIGDFSATRKPRGVHRYVRGPFLTRRSGDKQRKFLRQQFP